MCRDPQRLRSNTQRVAPELHEEILGISEGSGIGLNEVLAYNCLPEVTEVPLPACTNFAFSDTELGPAIAKTNDGDTPDCDWFYVVEHIDTRS